MRGHSPDAARVADRFLSAPYTRPRSSRRSAWPDAHEPVGLRYLCISIRHPGRLHSSASNSHRIKSERCWPSSLPPLSQRDTVALLQPISLLKSDRDRRSITR